MPNRILKESVCRSREIAALSAESERLFYRLLVQCDDFGRFHADAELIRAACFARQLEDVSADDVAGWLADLERVGLMWRYEVADDQFVQVTTWDRHQRKRALHSKHPDPASGHRLTPDRDVLTDDSDRRASDNGQEGIPHTRGHPRTSAAEKRETRNEKREVEKRDIAEASPLAVPAVVEAPTDANVLAAFLKTRLKDRGVTVFARDWHLRSAAVAQTMLVQASADEIREGIDWLLADSYVGPGITDMLKVRDKFGKFQQAKRGHVTGPKQAGKRGAEVTRLLRERGL